MDRTVQAMYDWIVEHPNATASEICAGVGLKKTPYTRRLLDWMWEQGYIVKWLDDAIRPARLRYFVQLTERMEGV